MWDLSYIYIQRAGFELCYVVQWDCNFFSDDRFKGLCSWLFFKKNWVELVGNTNLSITSNFNANCSWWFAGNLVWGWISMASSPQSNEMTSDTIPANSNIPSPSSIALQIHMNGLPSSAQTGRLQFIYNKCVSNFLFL